MFWNAVTNNNYTTYQAAVEADDLTFENAKAIWDKLFNSVLIRHQHELWDSIRVELWPDSGRVILFPSKIGMNRRIEIAALEVTVTALLEYWEKMNEADVSDDEFDKEIMQKVMVCVEWLVNGIQRMNVLNVRDIVGNKMEIPILIWDADNSLLKQIVISMNEIGSASQ